MLIYQEWRISTYNLNHIRNGANILCLPSLFQLLLNDIHFNKSHVENGQIAQQECVSVQAGAANDLCLYYLQNSFQFFRRKVNKNGWPE